MGRAAAKAEVLSVSLSTDKLLPILCCVLDLNLPPHIKTHPHRNLYTTILIWQVIQ
jgi:hypothetical protein